MRAIAFLCFIRTGRGSSSCYLCYDGLIGLLVFVAPDGVVEWLHGSPIPTSLSPELKHEVMRLHRIVLR